MSSNVLCPENAPTVKMLTLFLPKMSFNASTSASKMPIAPGSVSFLIPRSVICCPAVQALKTHFAQNVSAEKDSVTTQHQFALCKVLLNYKIMKYFLPLSVCLSLSLYFSLCHYVCMSIFLSLCT